MRRAGQEGRAGLACCAIAVTSTHPLTHPHLPDSGSLSSPSMPSNVSHRVALLTTVLPLQCVC